MDVARLNMSHGTYEEHETAYRLVRQASDESGHGVGIFADLQGLKIRETFAEGSVRLMEGQQWTITTRDVPGDASECGTTYQGLPGDVSPGDPILIDDGKVRLTVDSVDGEDVHCTVAVGGKVSNNKGINLPGVAVSVPALSEKDVEDLRWALRLGVDFVALSFVRSAADANDVHKVMEEEGRRVPVIAKIEKPQALEAIDEHRRVVRRDHGRARRPGGGVPARGRTRPSEARHRQGPPPCQARDRGDPDAGVDDRAARRPPAPRPPTWPTRCSTAPTP